MARSSHGKVQLCLCPGSGHIRCTRYCYTKDQLPPMSVTAQDRSRSSVLFHAPRPTPRAAVCTCRTCKCRVPSCSAQGRGTDCRPEKHQGRKHVVCITTAPSCPLSTAAANGPKVDDLSGSNWPLTDPYAACTALQDWMSSAWPQLMEHPQSLQGAAGPYRPGLDQCSAVMDTMTRVNNRRHRMVMQSRKYRLCRCLGYNINSCIRADIQRAVPAYKAALKVIMACSGCPKSTAALHCCSCHP